MSTFLKTRSATEITEEMKELLPIFLQRSGESVIDLILKIVAIQIAASEQSMLDTLNGLSLLKLGDDGGVLEEVRFSKENNVRKMEVRKINRNGAPWNL